jgi:hypothetical protein
MEITPLSSASLAASQGAGVRSSSTSPAQQSADDLARDKASLTSPEVEATGSTARQDKAEEQKAAPARPDNTPQRAIGRIRFETDEGTRVAKFFDTKDVLIYQVPPKGAILLVRAQETTVQDQVETSA